MVSVARTQSNPWPVLLQAMRSCLSVCKCQRSLSFLSSGKHSTTNRPSALFSSCSSKFWSDYKLIWTSFLVVLTNSSHEGLCVFMSASIFSEKSGQRLTRSERLNTNLHGKRSNCISITERNQEKKMIALSSSLPDVKNTAEKFNTCSFHHKIDHIQVSLLTDKLCVSIEPFFFFAFILERKHWHTVRKVEGSQGTQLGIQPRASGNAHQCSDQPSKESTDGWKRNGLTEMLFTVRISLLSW